MTSVQQKTHLACPHCGFHNFSISAYCSRCERPLRMPMESAAGVEIETEIVVAETVPQIPPPLPHERTPQPMPVSADMEAEVVAPPLVRPPLAAVPPPVVPSIPDHAPIPLPTEAANKSKAPAQPVEIEVSLATSRHVLLAQLLDFSLILVVGLTVALVEGMLFEDPMTAAWTGVLDLAANWLHAHPGPALHGLLVAVGFGILYAAILGRGGGRTLGRAVTDTVLVEASGRTVTWRAVLLRALMSFVSVLPFGAGYFWAIVDAQARTWHDKALGTVVVRRKIGARP